jgi:hypothetical protein
MLQTILVYIIASVCVLLAFYFIFRFSNKVKKGENACANCDKECELKKKLH